MAGVALVLVYAIWYRPPLAAAAGIDKFLLLMLAVDVVLGPVLTFVVYDTRKKSLSIDLAIIVAIQVLVFFYGLWIIAVARPAWIVFNVDRFDLVHANELPSRFAVNANSGYKTAPWLGPGWVAARNPGNPSKQLELIMDSMAGGPDLPQRPDLYVPLVTESSVIQKKIRSLPELNSYNAQSKVSNLNEKWPEADGWLPLMAKTVPMVVLLRRSDAKVVAVVDLRPWS